MKECPECGGQLVNDGGCQICRSCGQPFGKCAYGGKA